MEILCCFLFPMFLSVWWCPFQFWTFYTVCTWQQEVLGKNHFQFFALIHHFNTENRELRALCDQITDVFFSFAPLTLPLAMYHDRKLNLYSQFCVDFKTQKDFLSLPNISISLKGSVWHMLFSSLM